jgi:hypothetical protein
VPNLGFAIWRLHASDRPAANDKVKRVRRTSTTMLRLFILAATVLSAGLVLPPAALAQANCDWYAKTALRQQQLNEEQKCNFKGDAWSADLKAHLNWCASVAPDVWKAQAQQRDQMLAQCAKK